MTRTQRKVFLFLAGACLPLIGSAAELETQSEFVPTSNLVLEQEAKSVNFQVVLNLLCFGRNLRGVANPLDPDGTLTFNGTIKWQGQDRVFKIIFPGGAFFNGSLSNSNTSVVPVSNIQGTSSIDFVNLDGRKLIRATLGNLTVPAPAASGALSEVPTWQSYSVSQQVPVERGEYYGRNGDLSATIKEEPAAGTQLLVTITAPGEEGWCGGYHSPLMLFFDKKLPSFTGESRFPLDAYYRQTFAWVEPNAPGYFLAVDRNNDGSLNDGEELFGSIGKPDGFKKLAVEDKNRDGVIDAKDPIFSKLLLWNDKNGDGNSQPAEIIKLAAKRVTSISLDYNENEIRTYDSGAQFRQTSKFTFLDSEGKARKGKVIDVWFESRGKLEVAEQPVQKAGPTPFDLPLPPHLYRGPASLSN